MSLMAKTQEKPLREGKSTMNKMLHIIATPRAEKSRTLKVTEAFLTCFTKKFPDCNIDTLNLFEEQLPTLTTTNIEGKMTLLVGKNLTPDLMDAWKEIEQHIERFLAADVYLISTPMWNFSIPYRLKHYIDVIVQPRYLFKYTEKGAVGLTKNKRMIIITSRGGDYSPGSPTQDFDYQEPYLRAIFGLCGIEDITFVIAQPMDALGPEVMKQKIAEAQGEAERLVDML